MPQTHILQHKSWHVYGKDNVARVRRDEENARKEAAELQRRADIAAAEHRVDILRQRARNGARTGSHDQQTAVGPDPTQADGSKESNRFILFEEGTGGPSVDKTEQARQQKEAQNAWEKKVGITTYLGQSSIEQASDKPWYLKAPGERKGAGATYDALDTSALRRAAAKEAHAERRRQKDLERLDPMSRPLHRRKDRDSKSSRKRDHSESTKTEATKKKKGKLSIEDMRRLRLERERSEKSRSEMLLGGPQSGPSAATWQYSNQYNPHLVRRR